MKINTTITSSDEERLHGKHVAVQADRLIQCPGCGKTRIPIRTTFGVMFIKYHDVPSRFLKVSIRCNYSEEILKPFQISQGRKN
jgi:hypothetical protein